MMSSEADNVIDVYNRHAKAWVAARLQQSSLPESGWLERFCALFAPMLTPGSMDAASVGGAVLDLGCGAGAPVAAWLAAQGHRVTGVDSSPAMIAMFRQRLPAPRHEAMVADMRSLSLGRSFNGILAWDSFFHLKHEDQRRTFAVFRAHAVTGTALMFSSGTVHGEAIGSLEGEPLYHASLDTAEYRQLLDSHGFEVAHMVQDDATCGGRTVWLARQR